MKNASMRGLVSLLLLGLAVSMAACTQTGGGLETYPQETRDEVPDLSSPDSAADTDVESRPAAGEPESEAAVNDTAPDFTILDADGNEVKLSDFFGTPIVLNFWASWCPPCKAELPDFEAAYKKYEGKVVFLMVNMTDGERETVEVAKSFVESAGYTFPVYFDTRYEAAYGYGVSSIPQTYFIDTEGALVARATGMIYASQLEQGIGMIYKE